MEKLERLIQDETGFIFGEDKKIILSKFLIPKGKLRTIVIRDVCLDISSFIENMREKKILNLPLYTNSYLASDINEELKKGEEGCLIYAVQFYFNVEKMSY